MSYRKNIMYGYSKKDFVRLENNHIKIDYIISEWPEIWGTSILNLYVYSPKKLYEENPDNCIIYLALDNQDINKCLDKLKTVGFQNVIPIGFLKNKEFKKNHLFLKNKDKLKKIMYDDKSKKLVDKIYLKRENNEVSYLDIISEEKQYFDREIFDKSLNINTYVDLGLNSERSILRFMSFCNYNYTKIYGFEPNPNTFKNISKFFNDKKVSDVTILPYAVSNFNGYGNFDGNKGGSSHLDNFGNILVKIITLDKLLEKNNGISFIKMDIEGEELNAIKGAVNLINLNKPILCISVYHNEEDIWKIPFIIHDLVPKYKLSIRHYGSKYSETILYAYI